MDRTRILIFRLSSFGDVILSTSFLKPLKIKYPHSEISFVTNKEWEGLLKGNPFVDHVLIFEKKKGFKGWINFCLKLYKQEFDLVFDLHRSLRTRLCFALFNLEAFLNLQKSSSPKWKVFSKDRFRMSLYLVLKRFLPSNLRPRNVATRFLDLLDSKEKPETDLRYLLSSASDQMRSGSLVSEPYLCVMPSSKWPGKEWPLEKHFELLMKRKESVLVLGQKSDRASVALFEKLEKAFLAEGALRQVVFLKSQTTFADFAYLIKNSIGFYGVDTGFFHFAEALKCPSLVIMGPTDTHLGYAPLNTTSRVAQIALACRPCSKNGRSCYRFWDSRACMNKLDSKKLKEEIPF